VANGSAEGRSLYGQPIAHARATKHWATRQCSAVQRTPIAPTPKDRSVHCALRGQPNSVKVPYRAAHTYYSNIYCSNTDSSNTNSSKRRHRQLQHQTLQHQHPNTDSLNPDPSNTKHRYLQHRHLQNKHGTQSTDSSNALKP
jgi:hypothetical protein